MEEQLDFDFGQQDLGTSPKKKDSTEQCCPKCAEMVAQLTGQLRAALSELKEAKRLLSVRS